MRRTAALLKRPGDLRKSLPRLMLFTDPQRTPDPVAAALQLPAGSAIVYRHHGAAEAEEVARALLRIARAGGLRLLIGADAPLAAEIGADGVHLPERMMAQARRLKARRPGWIVTTAAHSVAAISRARTAGADAAVLSAVFPSRSPSAGAPIGPIRLAAATRVGRLPIYALGGVNEKTARRLKDVGLAGFAAVEGLRT